MCDLEERLSLRLCLLELGGFVKLFHMGLERLRGFLSELVPHKGRCDYWAVRPALKGAIVRRLNSLSCGAQVSRTSPDEYYTRSTHRERIRSLRAGL
jgi:hypothetical protein